MTRISTFGQNQILITQMLRNQTSVQESQVQVSTGKKAITFKGFANESSALLSAKTVQTQTNAYIGSNEQLKQRLEIYNLSLGEIGNIADTLRQDMITAVNLNSGLGLIDKIEAHLDRLISQLSTTYEGKYVFAGNSSETIPISISDTTSLLALGSSANAFQNSQLKPNLAVDENQTLEYGVLADDAAAPLLEAMYRILQFHNGTLPTGAGAFAPAGNFSDPLTPAQRDFIISELSNAEAGVNAARQAEAKNGVNLQMIDRLIDRQSEENGFLGTFISDIEDVNIGEAIFKLNQDQTTLQASLQTIARLNQITLLQFI